MQNDSEDNTSQENAPKESVPAYLKETYWWAYLSPKAVAFFERQWLVNLILFGNYKKLRNALIEQVNVFKGSRSLQIACAYGDFSSSLLNKIGVDSHLTIIDVAQIQLDNLQKKLGANYQNVELHKQDSSSLDFDDNSFDNVLLFFLLHEQPKAVREKTVNEAVRVCKPGGKIIYIDYHKPTKNSLLTLFMTFILKTLEPFALDLWNESIESLHNKNNSTLCSKQTYFFSLYQRVVFEKNKDS